MDQIPNAEEHHESPDVCKIYGVRRCNPHQMYHVIYVQPYATSFSTCFVTVNKSVRFTLQRALSTS
uniref:Uncharacterized protein n=1 Tax=Anguilla anguilla TaxID=7936 RepID=A0A0E9QZ47_ANGAN